MKVVIEISLYALTSSYEQEVLNFIDYLKKLELHTKTNGVSTQIFGQFDEVMPKLTKAIEKQLKSKNQIVFNLKILNNPLPEDFNL